MQGNGKSTKKPDMPENLAFRKAAQLWLADKKDSIAATTYDRYSEALERDICPRYGDMPVSEITDEEIARFTQSIAEKTGREGKSVTDNKIRMTSGILAMVVEYVRGQGKQDIFPHFTVEKQEFEWLDEVIIERICLCAKRNRTPEMLAVMLALFCGIRQGEICALSWDDVSLDKMEIYVHRSAHRVRTMGRQERKTEVRVEEILMPGQIRRVAIPKDMRDYVKEFYREGKCVLTGLPDTPADARTLVNRVERIFELYNIKNVNFQKMRKTYVMGKADEEILGRVFRDRKLSKAYGQEPDRKRLIVEMSNDLVPLRMLAGLLPEEVSEILGIPETIYQSIEKGCRNLEWVEYLTLLFLFLYNERTKAVVDTLGLYPESLKQKLSI